MEEELEDLTRMSVIELENGTLLVRWVVTLWASSGTYIGYVSGIYLNVQDAR